MIYYMLYIKYIYNIYIYIYIFIFIIYILYILSTYYTRCSGWGCGTRPGSAAQRGTEAAPPHGPWRGRCSSRWSGPVGGARIFI